MQLADRRRFYADEIQATSNLMTSALVAALATVPREQFLPSGPWTVRGEADFQTPPRQTPDADPRHVYHNLAVAIDPARQLFNGAPGLIGVAIDRLSLAPGDRVLHIGAGTGYYSALMAHCVGPTGRVAAIEVEPHLADAARINLATMPWVEVGCGNGAAPFCESFDAILVNAGVTHPLDVWLDALARGGRMILPLTVATGPTIGKGPMFLLSRTGDAESLSVRLVTFVAVYSAVGIRDAAFERQLAARMNANPYAFTAVRRLRRDQHDPGPSCWLHATTWCLCSD